MWILRAGPRRASGWTYDSLARDMNQNSSAMRGSKATVDKMTTKEEVGAMLSDFPDAVAHTLEHIAPRKYTTIHAAITQDRNTSSDPS